MSFQDHVERVGVVETTMKIAHARAAAGAPEGTTIVAQGQSAGQGRLGRTWHASDGAGLFLTVVLRPGGRPDLPTIGLVAGVATLEAAHRLGARAARVKWPNDVLVGDRKLAGILVQVEAADTTAPVLLVGIGLNLRAGVALELPEDLQSLYIGLGDLGIDVTPDAALVAVLEALERRYAGWRQEGIASIFDVWRQCDALAGRTVVAGGAHGRVRGVAMGLAPDGQLRVRTEAGEQLICAGEVTLVRPEK